MNFDSTKKNKKLVAISWLLLACFLAILTDAITTAIVNEVGLLQVTYIKHIFSFLIIGIFLIIRQKKPQYKPNIFKETARGVTMLAGTLLWLQGLKYSNMACAGIIAMSQPLFIMVFSHIFLKENFSLTKFTIMSIGLSILICIILFSEKTTFSVGTTFLIIGAVCWALLDVITKMIVTKNKDITTNTFYTAFFATLCSIVLIFINGIKNINLNQLIILTIVGGLYNLMIVCFTKAFNRADLSTLAPYKYSELVFAFILDFIFFNNLPNKIVLYYAICILPGSLAIIVIDVIDTKVRKKQKSITSP